MIALSASQDTYVNQGSPAVNYGLDPIQLVSRTEFLDESYTLVQFNINSIPVGSVINSASLERYLGDGGASVQTLTAYWVASNWSSTVVTWNSQPSPF